MDRIPPSICPAGIFRPPQQSPTAADAPARPLSRRRGQRKIIRWLGTLVRRLFRLIARSKPSAE